MMLKLYLLFLSIAANPGQDSLTDKAYDSPDSTATETSAFAIPFDIKSPDAVFEMPDDLFEISGLTISKDAKHLIAIQDENGLIYKINKESGKVEHKFEFWKDGDYEGVEVVGEDIYVIKSTGTIYRIKNPELSNQEVVKYKFFLNKDNDVEGLGYDSRTGRLLLACKAKAGTGEHLKLKKGIYAFNVHKEDMDTVPALVISLESIISFLEANPSISDHEKLSKFFIREDGKFKFSPSAIAIHPISGEVYITSAVGKLLMILSPDGEIIHLEKLKKSIHPQPEGLCFDQQGNMYIANEGKDDSGFIYKYNYQR